MNIAVKILGSTPTSIMGALEPLTAVVIGVFVFNEVFTLNLACGIVLILISVLLIVLQDKIKKIGSK
jgi:drug/metabolite transporter (DMT)-like permease